METNYSLEKSGTSSIFLFKPRNDPRWRGKEISNISPTDYFYGEIRTNEFLYEENNNLKEEIEDLRYATEYWYAENCKSEEEVKSLKEIIKNLSGNLKLVKETLREVKLQKKELNNLLDEHYK